MKKIAFFDSKNYDKEYFNKYNTEFEIKYFEQKLSLDSVEFANGFDAVCVFVNDDVNANVIEKLAKMEVKAILSRCAGFNNVDIESAKQHHLEVMRVPSYSPNSVAEFAVTLLLSLNRRMSLGMARTKQFNYSLEGLVGTDINGKVVGVVSTGKIGQIFAEVASSFGAKVIAYDLYPNEEWAQKNNVKYVDLDTLYAKSNIISLHTPLFKETHHMINKDTIAKMQDGVKIINGSRGGLINTVDLIEGLETGKIGGAGLDVYENEQSFFFQDCSSSNIDDEVLKKLVSFDNVILMGHQSFLTDEALAEIAKVTLSNFHNFITKSGEINSVLK